MGCLCWRNDNSEEVGLVTEPYLTHFTELFYKKPYIIITPPSWSTDHQVSLFFFAISFCPFRHFFVSIPFVKSFYKNVNKISWHKNF